MGMGMLSRGPDLMLDTPRLPLHSAKRATVAPKVPTVVKPLSYWTIGIDSG